MNSPKFIIERTTYKKFFFSLKDRAGNTLVTSPAFEKRIDCYNAIESVAIFAPIADTVEKYTVSYMKSSGLRSIKLSSYEKR